MYAVLLKHPGFDEGYSLVLFDRLSPEQEAKVRTGRAQIFKVVHMTYMADEEEEG